MDDVCGSKFWDWNMTWYSENPDFTPCFKNTVLVWIPCVFLWMFSPLQIYFQRMSKYRDISFSSFNIIKLILIVTAAILQFIDAVHKYAVEDLVPIVYFYTLILNCITFVLFFILTFGNLKMGIRWSGILFTFSLIAVICGIPNLCTAFSAWSPLTIYSKHNTKQLSYILYYTSLAIIFILNFLTDEEPQRSLCLTAKYAYPGDQGSFLSKTLFFWFEPLIWRSYKKPVKHYLWNLHRDDSATEISVKGMPVSIVKELFKKYESMFWYSFFVKTIFEISSMMIYIVFYFLISVFEERKQVWKAYLYSILIFMILLVQTFSASIHSMLSARLDIRVNGAVLCSLYSKALKISNGARKDYTTSDIVNLVSTDTYRVKSFIQEFQNLWGFVVQIVISFIFLWFILGSSVIIDIFVFFIIAWISYHSSRYMRKLQTVGTKNKDVRGKFMQEIFTGIKVIKMYAWEQSFKKVASALRYLENKTLKSIGIVNTVFQVIYVNSPFLICLCSYAAYTFFDENNVLNITTAFASMAVFNYFRVPFGAIPLILLSLQQFLISVKRIDKFLNSEELDENAVSHESTDEPLTMEDATFSWENVEGDSILQHLNVRINKGSLVAIVGPVGAGKSSLISAFLGEMYKISGYVTTNGTIAYVPQQAWILNTTVKQNITLDEHVDSSLYNRAIEACALQPDLENFPAGDMTEIGEKGINLSGGQKQRISLARAVCSNADVHFFDDPLSAVDSHVANHIFREVLGPNGILNKKTRVLVTHSIKFLSYTDQIIVLKDGKITENGTYDELMSRNDGFAQTLHSLLNKNEDETEDDGDEDEVTDEVIALKEGGSSIDTISVKSKSPSAKSSLRRRKEKVDTKPLSNKLIEDEKIRTKQISGKLYWNYISAAGVPLTIATIILFSIYQSISILANVWLSSWISQSNSSNGRYFYLLIYTAFGVGQTIILILATAALYSATIKVSTHFYDKLLSCVLKWPMSSFDATPIGRIISRFGDDIYILDNVIAFNIFLCSVLVVRYVSIFILAILILPLSVIIVIPAIMCYYIIKKLFDGIFQQLKRIEMVHKSPLYSHVVESISGVQSIRAYGFREKFISQFKEKCDHASAAYHSTTVCMSWLDSRCTLLGAICICSITILCALHLDSLNIAYVALLMTYALQFAKGVNFAIVNIIQFEDNLISVERIKEYIEFPQEHSSEKSLLHASKNWPTNGDVIFHNYQLRYREGLDLVLKGLSFKIESGEKIGIVGRTGAGKSSIILGLFRIMEPAGGTILIDNVDITTIGLHELRSKLTVIPQDPVLFSGTLRFNLDPFEDHEDEHLWGILEKSHLKSFVQSLPGGLRYNIEEGGRNLSFGQRQLICLARALLRKSKILVLDEATASVDMQTDELIQKTIRTEFPDCTVITIAHRLNTLQDYDKILILDGGRTVNFDTPKNLLKIENSRLRDMVMESEFKN